MNMFLMMEIWQEYLTDYIYQPKLVIVDDMSLGARGWNGVYSKKSEYVDFVTGDFQGQADFLVKKYGEFDFVWFDCGGPNEYQAFLEEYWEIC